MLTVRFEVFTIKTEEITDITKLRPNKKKPVLRVTPTLPNLLVFRFLKKKYYFMHLKDEIPFKMHKILFFSQEMNK